MDILKIAAATIKEYNLIERGDSILVGLSGGADSVALLHVLLSLKEEYGITIACAHVNHSLRDTAERDMNFCENLCKKLGVQFFCLTVDIREGAKSEGMSEELFARGVRYDYFNSLGFDKVATAHNKNDAAETLLFNFMRGSTVKGLSGIPYRRGNVIRPLLDIKKSDIYEFCNDNGYAFVTDETNLEAIYTRNKIRLNLIPEIEKEFNSNFVDVVTKNARLFKEDSDFLEALAEKAYSGEVKTAEICLQPAPVKRRILQLHWKKASGKEENLSSVYIDGLLDLAKKNHTGKEISLPMGFSAKIVYGKLIIEKKQKKVDYEYKIYPGKILNIPEIGKNILITETGGKPDFYLSDAEGLTVRNRRSGDVFSPVGMTGRKKLSDYFTDKKIPSDNRDSIPVLLKNERIVSVGGMRTDRHFWDTSKRAYKIEIKEADHAE